MEVGRPHNSANRSRKGKKSWRKNINIDDVEAAIIESREREVLYGKEIDEDFIIDTTGDDSIRNKNVKVLKSSEILANKSKVAALDTERNRRTQGIKKHEIHRLMKVSGRVQGKSKLMAQVDADGLYRINNNSLWDESQKVSQIPDILTKSSIHSITKSKAPDTIKRNPIKLHEGKDASNILHSGKSYNPSLDSWKLLINSEYNAEKEKEIERQKLLDFQEKLKNMLNDLESDDDEVSEEPVSEPETTDAVLESYKISVNPPTQLKKKNRTQRNKELRHKKRVELEQQLKELKKQIHEISKIDEYTTLAIDKNKGIELKKGRSKKLPQKIFKYDSISRPLEVKLSDELTGNLKNIKPEGNLFYDTMINLQQNGKVEARIPVAKKRKYRPKLTEKWTYKDFK